MKPYEGCAVCVANELQVDCTYQMCVFTLASKDELIRRLSDNVNYTPYDHICIKEALLKEYDFDFDNAHKQNNPTQKSTVDMKCDGSNCYKCLFWKLANLNICENEFFTLASEKELIRRLDEYENRRDDIIKTLKEQYGYDYETKSIIDLDSGIRFKNHDDIMSTVKYWWRVASTDYLKRFETNNERDDVPMHVNDMINMDNGKLNDDSVNMPSKSKIVETIDSLDISNVSNKEELIGLIIINILKLF